MILNQQVMLFEFNAWVIYMRFLAIFLLGVLIVGPSYADKIAPQQGGATDGSPIIDSAGPGGKGTTLSLGGDRSSCLSPEIRLSSPEPNAPIPPLNVTNGYEAGSVWVNNKCSMRIEFKFCSTGPVNDGFNCKPRTSPVHDLDGQYFTVYGQGEWVVDTNQSTPASISIKNKLVWFACESSDDGGLPLITQVDPPMGKCWKPQKSDKPADNSTSSIDNPLQQLVIDQRTQEQAEKQNQEKLQAQQEEAERQAELERQKQLAARIAAQVKANQGIRAQADRDAVQVFGGVVNALTGSLRVPFNNTSAINTMRLLGGINGGTGSTLTGSLPASLDCSLAQNANIIKCVCIRNPVDLRCITPGVANKPTPTSLTGGSSRSFCDAFDCNQCRGKLATTCPCSCGR